MPYDSFTLKAVVNEMQQLCGAKINKIYQPDRFSIILKMHAAGNFRLLISAHPQNARMHLSTAETENPAKAPVFCMVLRKYLENARLRAVSQIPNERIARLDFSYINELGDEAECSLIAEMMGKHSNIILINDKNIIIDGIRRYTHAVSRYRQVLPNEEYIAPPPQNKPSWQGMDAEQILTLMQEQQEGEIVLEKALMNSFAGFSPFAARDIAQKAGLKGVPLDELGVYEAARLYEELQKYAAESYQPCVMKQNGALKDVYCFIPAAWQEDANCELSPFDSVNSACDYFYANKGSEDSFDAQKRELLKIVRGFAEKSGKKLEAQKAELATAQSGEEWKEKGDLLAANLWQVQKGMNHISLADFYHEGEQREIELLPELSPQENLSRFYKLYNKMKNASREIIKHVESTEAEYEYLLSVEAAAEDAANPDELEAIKDELRESGYLKEQRKAKQKPKALPPLEFISSDGFTILVGRNNKQNDQLTLKIAAKNDIWLHTQKIHGSHVIIRTEGREVPMQTIEEAAALAVLHSKAKGGGKAPVDYTEVSQVKKPNGAKPGMVIYFQQKTILAEGSEPQQSLSAKA